MKFDELKAYTYDDILDGDADDSGYYYPKSEADKVIAEKDKEIAELKEEPKPRRATWLEVARWCATGNGLVYDTNRDKIDTGIMFKPSNESEPIMDEIKVRKWSDEDWHEPTAEYMGLEEK